MSNSRIFVAKMRESDELKHYGIDGQKWGKRNGPPYPLANVDRSLAERRANTESESSKRMRGAFDENDSDNSNGSKTTVEGEGQSRRRDDDPNIVDGEYREVKNENSQSTASNNTSNETKKAKNSRDLYGKNVKDMSDDELKDYVNRREQEKKYESFKEKNKFDSASDNLNTAKKQAEAAESMLAKFADQRDRAQGKYNFDTSEMSNEELRRSIERMELNQKYSQLKSNTVKKGSDTVHKLFAFGMGGLSLAATALGVAKAIKELKD